jgi:hypothetical protein
MFILFRNRCYLVLGFIFFACTFSSPALPNDSDVEAAFIFNIVKYTDWPSETLPKDGNLFLCYVGESSPLGKSIAELKGKQINLHNLEIRTTTRLTNLGNCHVIVLGDSSDLHSLNKVNASSALIIGNGESFVDEGGGIGLFSIGNRIRFDINLDSTSEKGLKISVNLLRLARNVRGNQ